MSVPLEVFSDLSERLNYNLPGFPLYVRKGMLHLFDRYTAPCHWHSDLEFIYVLNGSMEYFVNGKTVCVDKGNGIFVNSRRLHYGFSTERNDCFFIVIAVHPSLLGENARIVRAYLEEKFGPHTDDFILLNSQIRWQREVLLLMDRMFNEMHKDAPNLLRLLSQAMSLCASMGDHLQQSSANSTYDQSWISVCKMTGFIHQHYNIKMTLCDIAAAGAVCRSRCCELFRKYIGQTPNNYLMLYRIQKGCEMLRETKRSIG
ncbi:MAG: AraC family ligand binding domain-containing protein, partial [Armatimonadota bacterium]